MSGGSYNYLFAQSVEYPVAELERMAERLLELGYEDYASRSSDALYHIRRASEILDDLSEVYRLVEWLDSHDISQDTLKKSIEERRMRKLEEFAKRGIR